MIIDTANLFANFPSCVTVGDYYCSVWHKVRCKPVNQRIVWNMVSVCMCMEEAGAGECGAGRYVMLDRLRVLGSVSLMSWALPDV